MKRLPPLLASAATGLAALATAKLLAAGKAALSPRSRLARAAEAGAPDGERSDEPSRWKRLAKHFGLFVAVLAVGGFLAAASGVIPIKASSGHWAVTEWLLEFGKRRSFATHSLGVEALPLDSLEHPALVLKGAGHYDLGCRPCHGSPEFPHPRVAHALTPTPPYLPETIHKWSPAELFSIVKHGIKFTGMPAWPAQERDDEVWAMVAFLRAFPDLDAAAYRRLVHGVGPNSAWAATGREAAPIRGLLEPDAAPAGPETTGQDMALRLIAESCGRCHGVDGLGRGAGAFPKLAGQRPSYLYAALRAYADGERHSGVMEPVAAGLRPEEMRALARYYGGREAPAPEDVVPAPAASTRRGAVIARQGIPSDGIPACAACHGPAEHPHNPFYPRLAGQYADYLVLQLQLFADEQRGGSPYARLMQPTAHRLTPEQSRAVARYYATLAPGDDRTVE